MARDIDLSKYNADEIEERAALSGLLPKGPQLAMLVEAEESDGHDKLVLEVVGGAYDGRKLYHRIYHSSNKGGDAQEFMDQCYIQWGLKLGLYTKGADGRPMPVEGRTMFADCIALHNVVVEVGVSSYEGKDRNEIPPMGIHLPDEVNKKLKAKPTWASLVGDGSHTSGTKGGGSATASANGSSSGSGSGGTNGSGTSAAARPTATAGAGAAAKDDYSDM